MSSATQGTLTPYEGEYAAASMPIARPDGAVSLQRPVGAVSETVASGARSAETPGAR